MWTTLWTTMWTGGTPLAGPPPPTNCRTQNHHPPPLCIKTPPCTCPQPVRYAVGMPSIFDEERQAIYLSAVAKGHSATKAARRAGVSPATVLTYAKKHPSFRAAELQAVNEAHDAVEDAVFRMATGQPTAEQRAHIKKLRAAHEWRAQKADEPDRPFEPPAPPAPSLKAAELWLTRRRPDRWKDDTPQGPTVSVQFLSAPGGLASFRAELEARKAEALPAPQAALPAGTDEALHLQPELIQ